MSNVSPEEWHWPTLQQRAIDVVRKGYEPEHVSGYADHLELQLLTLPSFEATIGWQVYRRQPVIYRRHPVENGGLPRFIATRTVWAYETDVVKFRSPMKRLEYLNRLSPSLSFQAMEVEPSEIQHELKRLRGLVLPPFVENNSVGLDGVRYEICQSYFLSGTRLNWWGSGPEQWRPLRDIFTSLWAILEDSAGGVAERNP